MTPHDFIRAARVPRDIAAWKDGHLNFKRSPLPNDAMGFEDYAVLCEVNMAGLHRVDDDGWGGDIVMEDSSHELRKHLPIFMHGTGRILKTGLGLGCVVRGLLASPSVEHIDVIEIDPRVIKHIGPDFSGNPRVTIHEGDALNMKLPGHWDFAWHDIYCEGNDGLQLLHAQLMAKWMRQADVQGAWAFPRDVSKTLPFQPLGSPIRRREAA